MSRRATAPPHPQSILASLGPEISPLVLVVGGVRRARTLPGPQPGADLVCHALDPSAHPVDHGDEPVAVVGDSGVEFGGGRRLLASVHIVSGPYGIELPFAHPLHELADASDGE